MRLPRDLSGDEIVRLLSRSYGYRLQRSRGSHMPVRVGTLSRIVSDVAAFLDVPEDVVRKELFDR